MRAVGAILMFLLVTIASVDPLCCSDGCEQGGMATTHSNPLGTDCPTCLSADVPHHDAPVVRMDIATSVRDLSTPATHSLFRADVDHPPRLA